MGAKLESSNIKKNTRGHTPPTFMAFLFGRVYLKPLLTCGVPLENRMYFCLGINSGVLIWAAVVFRGCSCLGLLNYQ